MKGVGCPLTGQTSRTSVLVLATTTFWERKKISHLNHLVIYKYILLIPWIHIHHFLSNHSWRHIRPSASIKLSALTRSGTFVQTSVSTTKCRHYLQKKYFWNWSWTASGGGICFNHTHKEWQEKCNNLANSCNNFDKSMQQFWLNFCQPQLNLQDHTDWYSFRLGKIRIGPGSDS